MSQTARKPNILLITIWLLGLPLLGLADGVKSTMTHRPEALDYGQRRLLHSPFVVTRPPAIFARQAVCSDSTQKACETNCINNDQVCCPGGGACDSSYYCYSLVSGGFGCCASSISSCGGAADTCNTQGKKVCSGNCIDPDQICCPGGGTCEKDNYCYSVATGGYRCCGNGQKCDGAADTCSPQGKTNCSGNCINTDQVCCPGGGACEDGSYCYLLAAGGYGCCANGIPTCGSAAITGPATVTLPQATATATVTADHPDSDTGTDSGTGTATISPAASANDNSPSATGVNGSSLPASTNTGVPGGDKKKSNTGAIVGGVVGGLAVLAGIGALIFFFVIKPRQRKEIPAVFASTAYGHQASEIKPDAAIFARPPELESPGHNPYPGAPNVPPPPAAGYGPQGQYNQQYPAQPPPGHQLYYEVDGSGATTNQYFPPQSGQPRPPAELPGR